MALSSSCFRIELTFYVEVFSIQPCTSTMNNWLLTGKHVCILSRYKMPQIKLKAMFIFEGHLKHYQYGNVWYFVLPIVSVKWKQIFWPTSYIAVRGPDMFWRNLRWWKHIYLFTLLNMEKGRKLIKLAIVNGELESVEI